MLLVLGDFTWFQWFQVVPCFSNYERLIYDAPDKQAARQANAFQ